MLSVQFQKLPTLVCGNIDFFYGFDNGNGQKEVPVLYIPPSTPISSNDVYFGLSEEEAISKFGGETGYLSFSLDNLQDDNVIPEVLLYTSDGSTYSETPREAGGQILPIIYVEGRLDGKDMDVLVGGFFSTVIEWSVARNSMEPFVMEASAYLSLFEVDYLVVDVLAVDDDDVANDGGSDFVFFVIDAEGNAFINDDTNSNNSSAESRCLVGVILFYTILGCALFSLAL